MADNHSLVHDDGALRKLPRSWAHKNTHCFSHFCGSRLTSTHAMSKANNEDISPYSSAEYFSEKLDRAVRRSALTGAVLSTYALSARSSVKADVEKFAPVLSRADVGFINLNETEPPVTDVCWLDINIGEQGDPQRVEISLYGTFKTFDYHICLLTYSVMLLSG